MTEARARTLDSGLRAYLLILASAAIVAFLHWQSFARIASMWSLMPYRHGYFLFPAAAYFLWQKRVEIGRRPVSGSWLGCLLLLGLTGLWIVARATAAQSVEQIAAVLMIPAMVLAVLGPAVFRSAAFPLLLTLAAVPVGETLVPGLMTITGDIAEFLLLAFGVPVFREGNLITVPSGWFQVANVCAGLNYLLAGVVTAIVFAHQSFAGWRKRVVFVTVAAVAFVLANGIRVFLVIYLHNLSNGRIFAHDHIWLGMVIFGLTLALLLVAGARISDRTAALPHTEIARPAMYAGNGSLGAAVASVVILAAGPILNALHAPSTQAQVKWPALPVLEGCEGPRPWAARWRPFMAGSDLERAGSYACGDLHVDVLVAVYASQAQGKELVSSENELIPDYLAARGTRARGTFRTVGDETIETEEVSAGAESPELVWLWYSVGDANASTAVGVKVLEAVNVLRFRRVPSAFYLVAVRGPAEDPRTMRSIAERAARTLWDSFGPGRVSHDSR